MHYQYRTQGVCSQLIDFDLKEGIVSNVSFYGGCNGNLKAISALVEGKSADEIIELLKGIQCGYKPTSCSDQLANALTLALEKEAEQTK